MACTTLRSKVLSILSTTLGIAPALQPHHAQHELIDDLGADSLEVALVAMELEQEFNIEINDCELFKKKNATVDDVVNLVSSKMGMEVPA